MAILHRDRLTAVHKDLCSVVDRAAELLDFDIVVTEGLRTIERQKKLVQLGASKTMNSRHLTGHAVDLAPFVDVDGDGKKELRWDWPLHRKIAEAMKKSAESFRIPLEWGGDWLTFKDGPHFQLPWKKYPIV